MSILIWLVLQLGMITEGPLEPPCCKPTTTNKMCPVMPDSEAESRWNTIYRGEKISFCCNNCIDSFRLDPNKYVANLPQFSDATTTSSSSPETETVASPALTERAIPLLLLVAFLGAWQMLKLPLRRFIAKTPRPLFVEMLVCSLAAMTVALAMTNHTLRRDLLKSEITRVVHHSTYYDHGYPPVPPRADDIPRLQATYYRGNDERSRLLYNGGNYLTAKLTVALERADGTPVQSGDDVGSDHLFLALSITQAPNTPARLYAAGIMDRMYLTKQYDALMGWESEVADRVPIRTMANQTGIWKARYPLGILSADTAQQFDPKHVTRAQLTQLDGVTDQIASWFISYRNAGYPIEGPNDLKLAGIEGPAQLAISSAFGNSVNEGIVYVCQENIVDGRQIGARFHYGIKYQIAVKDGRIEPQSTLWLGSLSRSQKAAKGAIPDEQWLGSEPLPSLPAFQNISESLLGVDDYPEL